MIQNFELCIFSNAYLHKNISIIAWYLYRRTLTWLKGGGPYLVSKSPLARALIDQHTARRSTQVQVHNEGSSQHSGSEGTIQSRRYRIE